jgi:hypothetical protein
LRLKAEGKGADAKIGSYNVESTGTTEIQKDYSQAETLKVKSLTSDRVELSLPLMPGEEMSSERVMFAAGPDYLTTSRLWFRNPASASRPDFKSDSDWMVELDRLLRRHQRG